MFTPADWRDIRLVAFDVDGTLYSQRPLRLRMARDMVLHSVTKRDLTCHWRRQHLPADKRAAG